MSSNNDIVHGFDDDKDESIKIRLQKIEGTEGCLVLYLTGYVDTYNSNFFQKRVNKVIEAGYTRLVFHCAALNYMSSTGIGSFTAFLKAVKPRNGDLVLLEIQPKVYEVFQLLGFTQFFKIKDSIEEAIAYFSQGFGNTGTSLFPKIFKCPICATKLKAGKPGRFRCSNCKTILAIDNSGQIFLG